LSDVGSNTSKTRLVGEDISLPCIVRVGAHIKWLRSGHELLPADGSVPFNLHGRFSVKLRGRDRQELLLRNVTLNDSDVYTCLVGSVHHIFTLTVLGNCKFYRNCTENVFDVLLASTQLKSMTVVLLVNPTTKPEKKRVVK